MKQRLTYLLRDPSEFNLEQIKVSEKSIQVRDLDAAKEQHLTLGLDELPQEIQTVLRQCHELHLRWASPKAYVGIAPYASRVSPGLHAFFTPRRGVSADRLCPLLKTLFGDTLKCELPDDSFVPQPIFSERFSTASSLSYYHVLPNEQWSRLIAYLKDESCHQSALSCVTEIDQVRTAQSVDFDYDAISNAVVLRIYWDHSKAQGWTESTMLQPRLTSIEVGILNNEKPDEPEELKLGGFLTVLGQDTNAKATLFSFPARHHRLAASKENDAFYNVAFQQPTGLHPKLQIELTPPSLIPPADACALHAYLTLPSYLFIDRYQFDDNLFLAEHNLRAMHSLAGATDLEAPDWVIPQWGSSALFELAHPAPAQARSPPMRSTIPLHLRYMPPTNATDGITEAPVPWPIVFWACKAEEGLKMSSSPFDRVNLGYDGLFGPRTMFYHVVPRGGAHMVETLRVPVLRTQDAQYIETGTTVTILLGTAWVCWKLFRVAMRSWSQVKSGEGTTRKMQ